MSLEKRGVFYELFQIIVYSLILRQIVSQCITIGTLYSGSFLKVSCNVELKNGRVIFFTSVALKSIDPLCSLQ